MNYFIFSKFLLRRHMEKNGLSPKSALIIDGARHEFSVPRNGKASYMAVTGKFGNNVDRLICNYGLIDSKNQFNFAQEIGNNN